MKGKQNNTDPEEPELKISYIAALKLGRLLRGLTPQLCGGGTEEFDRDFIETWAQLFTMYGMASIATGYMRDEEISAYRKNLTEYAMSQGGQPS